MRKSSAIFLFALGVIICFWPHIGLIVRLVTATLIITIAGLQLTLKKNEGAVIGVTWILVIASLAGIYRFSKPEFESVEDFMKDRGEFDVRYADVEKLSKNFGTEKWEPYQSRWERSCSEGKFNYCRLASYVPRVKRENKKAENFLRLGCTNRDFISCYNYYFYDEFNAQDRSFAKDVILSQCTGQELSAEFRDICEKVKRPGGPGL